MKKIIEKNLIDKMYVMGKIEDDREGRHKPLFLHRWHEVIRNTEVVLNDENGFD